VVQSAVALHLYKEGGLDPLQTDFRVNPTVLGNKSREKLGTLTVSAHAWTVRAATADSPDRGPSGLRAGPSARPFLASNDVSYVLTLTPLDISLDTCHLYGLYMPLRAKIIHFHLYASPSLGVLALTCFVIVDLSS
jgi:hypothetical protein